MPAEAALPPKPHKEMFVSRFVHVALIILFLGMAVDDLGAQTPSATLVGVVTDPSGSAIAQARVGIRNPATNEVRNTASDQKGEFIAPNLAPGIYEVSISKEGFQTLRQTNVELQLDQSARMEFHLEIGSVSQSVEITASVPLINTENAVKGDVVVSQEIVEMPLDGRDFTDLAMLIPGVLPKSGLADSRGGPMAINGARADNSNYLLDGFNNQNPQNGQPQVRPNLDAMQEFKMQTTGYSAETGRLAGGVMNMVLKSGGNDVHGAVFEFLRNDIWDSRNFFDRDKGQLHRNQFGATVSGPVVIPHLYNGHDRTFFLFSWESYRQSEGRSALGVVPALAERQGDFSALPPIKDPLSAGACNANSRAGCFPGNQIPLSRISPVALKVQAYFPLPNRPGPNNYYAQASVSNNWDSPIIKIDHRLTSSDNLSVRFLKRYSTTDNPFAGGSNLGIFGTQTRTSPSMAGLTYTRIFSPTLFNELRFGLTRTAVDGTSSHQGTDYNSQFGMAGGPTDPRVIGFPLFRITNYEPLGDVANEPNQNVVNNYNLSDSVTWVKGSHLIKFGADMLRFQFYTDYSNNSRGLYNFLGNWTTQPYADFMLGMPNSTTRLFASNMNYLLANNYSAFFQDDWKVTSRLTLNLGLRYELPMPAHEKRGRWSNFVPEAGKLVIASDASLAGTGIGFTDPSRVATAQQLGFPDSLVYPDYRDLAPRFGLAWRPFGGNRTVIRGGYGIFYGSQMYNDITNTEGNVFPFVVSETVNRQPKNPEFLTIANPFPVQPTLTSNVLNANGWELHAPTPYLQSWNLTVERDLGMDSAVEAGYIGSKGTHLNRLYNINQPVRSAATAPNFPYPYPGWNTINMVGFGFDSVYNAANITIRRRFARNFFYRISYIYSKSIDNASQLGTLGTGQNGAKALQDPRDFRAERGRSDFDIGHSFTMSFSWTVPWKTNLLLRGWQLAGTGVAHTGAPFTPMVSNVNPELGEAVRPNRMAKGTVANPTVERWYDPAAFPEVPTGSYTFGTSGRDILDGPGQIAMNLSLIRNFNCGEKRQVQIRWEVFNALNHANFAQPVVFVNMPNAGTITSAGDPRRMQFGARFTF